MSVSVSQSRKEGGGNVRLFDRAEKNTASIDRHHRHRGRRQEWVDGKREKKDFPHPTHTS